MLRAGPQRTTTPSLPADLPRDVFGARGGANLDEQPVRLAQRSFPPRRVSP
jgi:hypothetical protein